MSGLYPPDRGRLRPEYAAAVARELSRCRRSMGERSPIDFARVYLATMFSKPFSPMHRQLFADLATLHQRRGSHLAVAAPRGHAKSTVVSLAYVLWCLVCRKEPYIVVVSGTSDQASKLLAHVKRQLESNTNLREDFPDAVPSPKVRPWRRDGILLGNDHLLVSYSTLQNLRGTRHGAHRPTLMIADDMEDKIHVVSDDQRARLADWFNSTLLKAGTSDTNVVVVGTVLHHDSLLSNLLDPAKSPGWAGRRCRAVVNFSSNPALWETWSDIVRSREPYRGETGPDAAKAYYTAHAAEMDRGTEVLWPEVYSYANLMAARLREGDSTFQAEFQNEPLDPAACVFARADIRFWDTHHADPGRLVEELNGTPAAQRVGFPGRFYGACDPSLGTDPNGSDYSAIVILFQPAGVKTRYVIEADLARRSPAETVERILRYGRSYRFTTFGVEANQFQQLLVDNLYRRAREAGVSIPVRALKNQTAKTQRILALEAELSQGTLVLARRHQLLLEQLRTFPHGRHDDGPDALAMVVSLAPSSVGGSVVQPVYSDADYGVSLGYTRYGFGKHEQMPDRLPPD